MRPEFVCDLDDGSVGWIPDPDDLGWRVRPLGCDLAGLVDQHADQQPRVARRRVADERGDELRLGVPAQLVRLLRGAGLAVHGIREALEDVHRRAAGLGRRGQEAAADRAELGLVDVDLARERLADLLELAAGKLVVVAMARAGGVDDADVAGAVPTGRPLDGGFGEAVLRIMLAVAQAVEGVTAVDLDALDGRDPFDFPRLPARTARWEGGSIRPAELLVIDPDGITLTTVEE